MEEPSGDPWALVWCPAGQHLAVQASQLQSVQSLTVPDLGLGKTMSYEI